MNKILLITFCFILTTGCLNQYSIKKGAIVYAVAELPAPVLNTADFAFVFGNKDGKTLHLDNSGLIRELEFIALPETVFHVEDIIKKKNFTVYKVTTSDYPYPTDKGYFVDSRFVKIAKNKPADRAKKLSSQEEIINKLLSTEGSIYVWGGNYKEGIPQMISFYPPSFSINPSLERQWALKGVDCSGLLYEATSGFTPRNTSSLVNFGVPVNIAGLTSEQIISKLKPLDIIVWKGHVIIVLDQTRTIESRQNYDPQKETNHGGVRIRNLPQVINEVLNERVPVDHYEDNLAGEKLKFVVRRWFEIMK